MTLPDSLRSLYPFTPRSCVTRRGARLSYLDEGPRSEEAVLMVHGNPTWSFYYRNVVRALSGTQRCIVPDHIGMGLSDKPQDYPYTLATRIEDLETLVDSLGLKRLHLVVHDWGGAIGFGLAVRRPEMIGRIVVLNTAAFFFDDIPARIALCRAPWLGALVVRGANGFAWPATWMAMAGRSLTPQEKAGYLAPYDSWANRVAVHQFVRDIPMEREHPTRATLEAVEAGLPKLAAAPLHLVWGGRDFCFHDGFLARWQALFPHATCRHLPHAGHYVLEDSDGVAVREIVQFLSPPTP